MLEEKVCGHNTWFYSISCAKSPSKILYCSPYAGGNAEDYLTWQKDCPSDVCMKAVCIPGSWRRFKEEYPCNIDELTTEIAEAVYSDATDEIYFFGHSMGAIIAFEVVRKIKKYVSGLIVSACASPQSIPSKKVLTMSKINDEDFIREVVFFNGLETESINNKFAAEIISTKLKKYFKLIAQYHYLESELIETPVWGIVGEDDPVLSN